MALIALHDCKSQLGLFFIWERNHGRQDLYVLNANNLCISLITTLGPEILVMQPDPEPQQLTNR